MTTITKTGHYRYRNGEPATVLTVERPGAYPVVSMCVAGTIIFHTSDGRSSYTQDRHRDLIPIPRKVWVNLDRISGFTREVTGRYYDTKEEADGARSPTCIACVEIELPEGES